MARQFRRRIGRFGFTLIELLVVVAIIATLLGIAMQVAGLAMRKTKEAQTVKTLEQLRNALAAYYAQYGAYPPVQLPTNESVTWRYPGPGAWPPPGDRNIGDSDPQWTSFINKFKRGLMYYLAPGNILNEAWAGPDSDYMRQPYRDQNPFCPSDAEIAAAKRWAHYVDKANTPGLDPNHDYAESQDFSGFADASHAMTNSFSAANDGWGTSLIYTTTPPFQSYRLYSANMGTNWEEREDPLTA